MARYKKGKSGNPKGRPKHRFTSLGRLEIAIAKVEESKKVDIYVEYVLLALKHRSVMIDLMKKLEPYAKPRDESSDQAEPIIEALRIMSEMMPK